MEWACSINRGADVFYEGLWGDSFGLCREIEGYSVGEDVRGECFYVVAGWGEASIEEGIGAAGFDQVEAGARAGALSDMLFYPWKGRRFGASLLHEL